MVLSESEIMLNYFRKMLASDKDRSAQIIEDCYRSLMNSDD